jgi:hypothetical protein
MKRCQNHPFAGHIGIWSHVNDGRLPVSLALSFEPWQPTAYEATDGLDTTEPCSMFLGGFEYKTAIRTPRKRPTIEVRGLP